MLQFLKRHYCNRKDCKNPQNAENIPVMTYRIAIDRIADALSGGGWRCGSVFPVDASREAFRLEALVFDQPSKWGIENGPVSKLRVIDPQGGIIMEYDRGWDLEPETDEGRAILQAVLAQFN